MIEAMYEMSEFEPIEGEISEARRAGFGVAVKDVHRDFFLFNLKQREPKKLKAMIVGENSHMNAVARNQ